MTTIETILTEAIRGIDKVGHPALPGEEVQETDPWFQLHQRLPPGTAVIVCHDERYQAEVVQNGARVGWLRFEFHNARFVWTPAAMVVDPLTVRSWMTVVSDGEGVT
jgi:hypothetical protein